MKNLFGALTAGMLVCTSLVASPVGNPSAPMSFEDGVVMAGSPDYSVRIGFSNDFVSDRKMQGDVTGNTAHVEASTRSHSVDLAFNFFNKVDIYGRLGRGCFEVRQNLVAGNFSLRSDSELPLWAAGGRAILYNWDFTTLSVFGEYAHLKGKIDDVISGTLFSGELATEVTVKDWNVGLALSHQIDYLAPYVAVRYSDAKTTYSAATAAVGSGSSATTVALDKLKSRSNVGASLGCTFMAGKKFDFTIEGRMFDEHGMSLVGALRF